MKIIKSFYLIALSLCATTLLHAQEEKKAVSNLPPAADNRPSIIPDLNTQSGVISKQMTTAVETPSPFKKDENKK